MMDVIHRKSRIIPLMMFLMPISIVSVSTAQSQMHQGLSLLRPSPSFYEEVASKRLSDTTLQAQGVPLLRNAWGVDVLVSNDGFGLGLFYRREFNEDLYGFIALSVSESKDEREVERFNIFGNIIVPAKLNRFLVIPLTFGVQRRFFREEILDTFRPYVNAGVGPTMILAAPFVDIIKNSLGYLTEPVEFFESLGRAQAHYTIGGYVGFGANFGGDNTNLFGVNFRYYITRVFGDGIPSLYDTETGNPAKNKTSFGGFFITLNVGMLY